jgi:RNA recognition motif-containing protein
MVNLFIVGFSRNMTEIELLEIFSNHGQVEKVTIVRDKDTGMSKSYGFITMTDQLGANRVIEALNGATIDDRTISVRLSENQQVRNQPAFKSNTHPAPASIYRGAIPEKRKRPRKSY